MDFIWRSKKIKFGTDLIWCNEKKIKVGADLIWQILPFCTIAPNFLRTKIYPNKVVDY